MNKSGIGLGVVVLVAVGAAFYAQHRANVALRREITGLREDVRLALRAVQRPPAPGPQAGPAVDSPAGGAVGRQVTPVENEPVAIVRAEVAAPPEGTAAMTQPAEGGNAPRVPAETAGSFPGKVIPAGELKNAGRATPEAGAETALWAAVGGEIDLLAGVLVFSPEIKARGAAWFDGLSESVRRDYGSPEKVIASIIAREAAALTSLQVLGKNEVAPDQVNVQVRFESAEGKSKEETFLMRLGAEGWGMVLPDETVETLARRLGEGK